MTDHRLTEEELTDIEIHARDKIAEADAEGDANRCECSTCVLARESLQLLAEVRALQRDLDSHARDIAGLRESRERMRRQCLDIVTAEVANAEGRIGSPYAQAHYDYAEAERSGLRALQDIERLVRALG